MVPKECQSIGARSGTTSRFLESSSSAASRVSGLFSSTIHAYTFSRSTLRFAPAAAEVGVAGGWVGGGAGAVGGLADIVGEWELEEGVKEVEWEVLREE